MPHSWFILRLSYVDKCIKLLSSLLDPSGLNSILHYSSIPHLAVVLAS